MGGAGLGLCLSDVVALDLRNRERTRWTVGWRDGIVLAEDGVSGCLRKKSVRMSLCGWGSEIFPNEEPLWRRDALRFPRAPRKQILATESSTPRARPGKKPTRMPVIGNLLQDVAV